MMLVIMILLSSGSNMTIRMLRLRLNILDGLLKLSLTTGAMIAKKTILTSKMNLISLNTSLEVGLPASATKYRKVNKAMKVTIP